jgi:hypothetical protein
LSEFSCKVVQRQQGKLTITVKNKWTAGWTKAWFYCKLLVHQCSQGGKSIHALRSHMSTLEFLTEPPVDYPDTDAGDVTFIKATDTIRGRDVMEEYLSCDQYPLSASFSFEEVHDGVAPVSKLRVPLLEFHITCSKEEDEAKFSARLELEAENVMGSYGHTEHETCVKALPNEGRLNRVFEVVGIAYGPRPQPGTKASVEALKKRKIDGYYKVIGKCIKVEVVVSGGWVVCMLDRTEALAFIPVGKGYQLSVEALLVLLFPYQCTTFILWLVGPLLAFW